MLELYRETNQVKNGWCARSVTLHLAAHGYSPEVADRNLERAVHFFLTPFQREGTLQKEVGALSLGGKDEQCDARDVAIILK